MTIHADAKQIVSNTIFATSISNAANAINTKLNAFALQAAIP